MKYASYIHLNMTPRCWMFVGSVIRSQRAEGLIGESDCEFEMGQWSQRRSEADGRTGWQGQEGSKGIITREQEGGQAGGFEQSIDGKRS